MDEIKSIQDAINEIEEYIQDADKAISEDEEYIRGEKCSVKNDMQFEDLILADYEIQDFLSNFVGRD